MNRSKDGNMEAGKDKIEGNQDKINGKIGAYRQFTTATWSNGKVTGPNMIHGFLAGSWWGRTH